MTIQVAVANCYGLAMASDRHVFRTGEARSTGLELKLVRLRGPVPAAMMASGPFAIFGLPVSRLALRLERNLARAESGEPTPEHLAEAVLSTLEQPLGDALVPDSAEADASLLAKVVEDVVGQALEAGKGDPRAAL